MIRYILFSLCVLLLLPHNSEALTLEDDDIKKIRQAETYLNNITTLQSNFVQISPYGPRDSTISHGNLYLKRPGKARWEYSEPTPLLIVINDGDLVYHDKELDQISYTSVDESLAILLTEEKISLIDGQLEIVEMFKDPYGFSFVLEKKDKAENEQSNEQLLLTFLYEPFRLRGFKYRDPSGRITTVEFKEIMLGETLEKELFIFKKPDLLKTIGR